MCPVTEQPDLSHVVIEYAPDQWCVESKSLKLYLWGFRDRAVFAEALAAEIAGEVMTTAQADMGDGHPHAAPARRHRSAGRRPPRAQRRDVARSSPTIYSRLHAEPASVCHHQR